jgi:YHS domain-containing protein
MTHISKRLLLASAALLAAACQAPAASEQAQPADHQEHAHPTPGESPAAASPSTAEASASLTRVDDRSLVCMVNNQFMGRPQIPIEVEGRTYYGCCEMCKGRLANDPASRVATDPVTQKSVDKAIAVIGKTSDGATFYFESDKTFAAYAAR